MGSLYLILALVFSLFIAIVALANNQVVTVSYVFGRAEASLILLIIGAAFAGALAMGLFTLFRGIRAALAYRELRHRKESLEKKVKTLEEDIIFLEAKLNRAVSVPGEPEPEDETANRVRVKLPEGTSGNPGSQEADRESP